MSKTYLMKRKGSHNWRIRLQYPGEPVFEKSLGTPDPHEADIIALRNYGDKIAKHKARLYEARPRIEPTWQLEHKPGLHVGPDGGHIFATDRELHFLDAAGATIRTTTNGGPAFQLSSVPRLGITFPVPIEVTGNARPVLAVKNSDDALFETYLKNAKRGPVTGHFEREARAVWALYKTLTDNTLLKDATREDGRKLVAHFEGQKLKTATIRKKIAWLTAAVNLAIGDGLLKFNPFSSVVPNRDDKQRREPLTDADIKNAKSNLVDRLDKSDQMLFRLLATTGMRLSEAFEIDAELKERGCRYVIVGAKTEQSLRRVPLPAGALPYLPKAIRGPLFQGGAPAASKRLNRFLNDIGITDPRKVLHSLRHRAQDRLRAAECPQDIRWALLGHEEKSVSEDYGKGFSVPQLKRWIDKIGF
jgi:integrase